jgi:hypothetical protein
MILSTLAILIIFSDFTACAPQQHSLLHGRSTEGNGGGFDQASLASLIVGVFGTLFTALGVVKYWNSCRKQRVCQYLSIHGQ